MVPTAVLERFRDVSRFLQGPCLLVARSGQVVDATEDAHRLAPWILPDQLERHLTSDRFELVRFLRQASRSRRPIPARLPLPADRSQTICRACRFAEGKTGPLLLLHFPPRSPLLERVHDLKQDLRRLELETLRRRRAESEKDRLQESIIQNRKLEGLGLMAGGIAHDFNNLLQTVLVNAELCLSEADQVHRSAESLKDIRSAALQAKELCQELLAYAGRAKFWWRPWI